MAAASTAPTTEALLLGRKRKHAIAAASAASDRKEAVVIDGDGDDENAQLHDDVQLLTRSETTSPSSSDRLSLSGRCRFMPARRLFRWTRYRAHDLTALVRGDVHKFTFEGDSWELRIEYNVASGTRRFTVVGPTTDFSTMGLLLVVTEDESAPPPPTTHNNNNNNKRTIVRPGSTRRSEPVELHVPITLYTANTYETHSVIQHEPNGVFSAFYVDLYGLGSVSGRKRRLVAGQRPLLSCLATDLWQQYQARQLVDLKLELDPETPAQKTATTDPPSFSIHRLVLAARSPMFHALSRNASFLDSQSPTFPLRRLSASACRHLIRYLYLDDVPGTESLSWSEAQQLYETANLLQLDGLKVHLTEILPLLVSPKEFASVLSFSELHQLPKLRDALKQSIVTNPDEVLKVLQSNPNPSTGATGGSSTAAACSSASSSASGPPRSLDDD